MAQAAAAGSSPTSGAQGVPRTKGSVMATTLVGAHAFEHLYAHSIPIIILAIITEFELGALSVGGSGRHPLHLRGRYQHCRRLSG